MSSERNPWTILKTETVFETPWIRVARHDVLNPKNVPTTYGTVHFKNKAIGVLAVDAHERIHLVGQYRFPLNLYSWEIPEGGCPDGESPMAAAERELREETGLIASRWTPWLELHLSNSVTDEHALVFLAQDLRAGPNNPEDSEVLMHKAVGLQEAVDMIERCEITDAISVAALLKLQLFKAQGRL